jgi:hypothetical protein
MRRLILGVELDGFSVELLCLLWSVRLIAEGSKSIMYACIFGVQLDGLSIKLFGLLEPIKLVIE